MAKAIVAGEDAKLYALLKNKNPGIRRLAAESKFADEADPDTAVAFAKKAKPDVVAIGPEAPLANGVSDALRTAGFPVAAPTKAAAEIETDKAFMRVLLREHEVPGNIDYNVFNDAKSAKRYLKMNGPKFALKPVGLTGGKGVRVWGDHFHDEKEAGSYVDQVFGDHIGGGRLIIEELLDGEEFTLQAFTDGARVVTMPAVQDHKRLLPGDEGPNTGGMGAYSQADGLLPFLPRADYDASVGILRKIVESLADVGHPYQGPIYGQFMLTHDGPRVIEVNARFGDPEAMNVLALLDTDFSELLARMADGHLGKTRVSFREAATVVKYVVPEGYGTEPMAGHPIKVDEAAVEEAGGQVFYAAVDEADGVVKTTMSRALAILGEGETLHEANEVCEHALTHVQGEHIFVRHDVGTRQLIERRLSHMKILRES
jgi:phosphoribosylamine--glycine ligase